MTRYKDRFTLDEKVTEVVHTGQEVRPLQGFSISVHNRPSLPSMVEPDAAFFGKKLPNSLHQVASPLLRDKISFNRQVNRLKL